MRNSKEQFGPPKLPEFHQIPFDSFDWFDLTLWHSPYDGHEALACASFVWVTAATRAAMRSFQELA